MIRCRVVCSVMWWCDVIGYDVVRYDVMCYGVVWYGMVPWLTGSAVGPSWQCPGEGRQPWKRPPPRAFYCACREMKFATVAQRDKREEQTRRTETDKETETERQR